MISINGRTIEFDKFPNNETTFKIWHGDLVENNKYLIKWFFEDDAECIHLHFIVNHIRDTVDPDAIINLVVPYLPYSRMDRPMAGRVFTLKSICEFINSLNFHSVTVYEPHSDVSIGLIKRLKVVNSTMRIAEYAIHSIFGEGKWLDIARKENVFIIFPDNGAEKRYSQQISEEDPGFYNIKTCNKLRDLETGNIKKFLIADYDPSDKIDHALIVDDLCSKGGTFILCAKALREAYPSIKNVYLAVTHCEKAIMKGSIPTSDLIDGVWIGDTMHPYRSYECEKINIVHIV